MEGLPSGYRPNVGVCLINDDNMVFVASKLNVPGAWQMPQVMQLFVRKRQKSIVFGEENGMDRHKNGHRTETKCFNLRAARLNIMFLMRLTTDESEINLANGEIDQEFSEWKWATPEEVIEQAVDYKRPTYEEVMKAFRPHFSSGKATKCYSTKW
ncbi:hypothetical protein DH2020_032063 [Rehmannia glutinosa]|uniref:Nudix hydrolase domain-containing protein n=1 Tax=Rehmannia glutinosa TaxID=99300 RepID=A0ABR0VGB2_REHGL